MSIEHPTCEEITALLINMGIDPHGRIFEGDQDPEYTACNVKELVKYLEYYIEKADVLEKRILGCFLIECLNEYRIPHDVGHKNEINCMLELEKDYEIHKDEIEYWLMPDEPLDPKNDQPIRKVLELYFGT